MTHSPAVSLDQRLMDISEKVLCVALFASLLVRLGPTVLTNPVNGFPILSDALNGTNCTRRPARDGRSSGGRWPTHPWPRAQASAAGRSAG